MIWSVTLSNFEPRTSDLVVTTFLNEVNQFREHECVDKKYTGKPLFTIIELRLC